VRVCGAIDEVAEAVGQCSRTGVVFTGEPQACEDAEWANKSVPSQFAISCEKRVAQCARDESSDRPLTKVTLLILPSPSTPRPAPKRRAPEKLSAAVG
jgi:hypothetical protein